MAPVRLCYFTEINKKKKQQPPQTPKTFTDQNSGPKEDGTINLLLHILHNIYEHSLYMIMHVVCVHC